MRAAAKRATQLAAPAGRYAAREARRLAGHWESEVAGGLARRLHAIPAHRIEMVMLTPARRALLDGLFWGLPHVLTGSRAHEFASSIRFQVSGPAHGDLDLYWLEYRDERWKGGRGERDGTQLTITAGGPLLVALACGRANPFREYASGRLRVRGNPIAAARLLSLIRGRLVPGSAAPESDAAFEAALQSPRGPWRRRPKEVAEVEEPPGLEPSS